MKALTPVSIVIAICLAGCGADQSPGVAKSDTTGSDRDEHGCIPSAGYRWCAHTAQCERPWELAKAKKFENTPENFVAFCKNPPVAPRATGA